MTTVESEVGESSDSAEPGQAKAKKPPKSTKARLIDVARIVAILLAIGFLAKQLADNWAEFWRTLDDLAWQSTTLSMVALVASIAVSTRGWQAMVDDLGKPIGYFRSAQICLVGSLGKYVPGGQVWAALLQMELGKKAGLARARIFTASLIQLGVGIVAALVLSLFAMPSVFANSPNAAWLMVGIPIGLVALHPKVLTWGTSLVLKILRRPPLDHRLGLKTIGNVFGANLGAWALQGVHLWLLANSIGAPGFGGFVQCIGAMAIAMTAGTFAFLLPGGVGVREAVLVAVLTATGITAGQALTVALVSRVMFIVADVITTGAAALSVKFLKAPAAE